MLKKKERVYAKSLEIKKINQGTKDDRREYNHCYTTTEDEGW